MATIILTDKDIARFRAKLKRDLDTGCLLWTASRDPSGRGRFMLNHTPEIASRVAFVLGGGIFTPEKPFVLHACDNPPCCEFTHLWAGTRTDNNADMAKKLRGRKSPSGLPFGASFVSNSDGRVENRFRSRVCVDGIEHHLGTYDTPEEASAIALEQRKILRGW